MISKLPCLLFVYLLFVGACSPANSSEPETAPPPVAPPVSQQGSEGEEEAANCWETTKQYPASQFAKALQALSKSNYKYKILATEEVSKNQTLLNKSMLFINKIRTKRKEPIVDTLTMNGIVTMRQARIRGTVAISDNTYPRAEIEEWEFRSEACVAEALGTITRIRHLIPWDRVSKSPMDYWQIENKLYFLVPGGFYMLEEAAALQAFLKRELS